MNTVEPVNLTSPQITALISAWRVIKPDLRKHAKNIFLM